MIKSATGSIRQVMKPWVLAVAGLAHGLAGCVSTSPGAFAPLVDPPPADPAAFASDFRDCADKLSVERPAAGTPEALRGAAGAAGGATMMGTGSALTALGSAGGATMGAVGIGMLLLIPLDVRHSQRRRHERRIQQAMAECLKAHGHRVARWKKLSPREAANTRLATPTMIRPQEPPPRSQGR